MRKDNISECIVGFYSERRTYYHHRGQRGTTDPGIPNLVRLEARNANIDGTGEITIRDLIRTALRMRPERIIVGEVRGEEALDMLQAFICTI